MRDRGCWNGVIPGGLAPGRRIGALRAPRAVGRGPSAPPWQAERGRDAANPRPPACAASRRGVNSQEGEAGLHVSGGHLADGGPAGDGRGADRTRRSMPGATAPSSPPQVVSRPPGTEPSKGEETIRWQADGPMPGQHDSHCDRLLKSRSMAAL
jgi:hypothetical protein